MSPATSTTREDLAGGDHHARRRGLRLQLGIRSRLAGAIQRHVLRVPPRSSSPYSTHLPVLTALAQLLPVRRVLELGPGMFSTPAFLDRGTYPDLLQLTSLENDRAWAVRIRTAIGPDPRWTLHVVEGSIAGAMSGFALNDVDLLFVDDSATESDRVQTLTAVSARQPPGIVVVHDFEVSPYRRAATGFRASYWFRSLNPGVGVLWNGRQVSHRQLRNLDQQIRHSQPPPPPPVEPGR